MLEIDEMINQELTKEEIQERKVMILYRLKELNREAFLHMKSLGKTWKQKYHELWDKPFWKEARNLLQEYFIIEGNGKLICPMCKKEINGKFILHHEDDFYNKLNFFTPLYVQLVHNSCHYKHHHL